MRIHIFFISIFTVAQNYVFFSASISGAIGLLRLRGLVIGPAFHSPALHLPPLPFSSNPS